MKLSEFIGAVGVFETEHRLEVRNRREAFRRRATDALCRRIRIRKVRVCGFQRLQLPHERIKFRIRDLGGVVNVVPLFVVPQHTSKLKDAGGGVHRISPTSQRSR
jgi:hypothetical protein